MSEAKLTAVRAGHEFDLDALGSYLIDAIDGFELPFSIRQFEGGQSNPTFLVSTPKADYVLRKQPPGDLLPSAHQVGREYTVMAALKDTAVPVPRMHCLCTDKDVIGSDFYVMDYVPGRIFADASLPCMSKADRGVVYGQLARVLADLHGVDPDSVGLSDFGRPGNYFSRQISRWTRQYQASTTHVVESMDKLIEWLPANVPDSETSTIVHGDFRVGNCLIAAAKPDIAAVIDWELSTLGDPLADIGYVCQMYFIDAFEFGLGGRDLCTLGIPDMQTFVADYCHHRGIDRVDNLQFSIIFNLFRLAAISQGVYKRGLEGNASSKQALEFRDVVGQYADTAWNMVLAQ
jgi:aminoglycoside phosphotransferase (APT) family kinase protein